MESPVRADQVGSFLRPAELLAARQAGADPARLRALEDEHKAHSPGRFKMTLPSSNQFPAIAFKRGVTDRVYRDHSALLWDIVPIMRSEIAALAASGVPYVQIDAPRYSYYIDPKWRTFVKNEMGLEPEAALDEAIRADNTALEEATQAGVTLAIHLCRGNNRSQWYAEGG